MPRASEAGQKAKRVSYPSHTLRLGIPNEIYRLSSPTIAEPTDVLTIAQSQIMRFAPVGQPAQLDIELLGMDPSGHEQDPMAIPASQMRQVLEDFLGVQDRSDDKLQLIIPLGHQRFDDLRCIADRFVLANPGLANVIDGAGIAQFRTDRPKVAIDLAIECTCRFDRDVLTALLELLAELSERLEDHRLTAGDHHMFAPKHIDLAQYFLDLVRVPFGLPGSVSGIAEPASQVAAAGANEDARSPGEEPFSLNALENLGNPDQSTTRFSGLRRRLA
jgi:hypothetical protein